MAVSKIKVSQLPKVGDIKNFEVLGLDTSTNRNAKADMTQLKGNTGDSAFEMWLKQPGNAGKTYDDYLAYNRQPATDAAESVSLLESKIRQTEQGRVTAEQGRAATEEARETAEQSRKATEQRRVTTEEERVTAEQGRSTAEQQRVNAENERTSAEEARNAAELSRKSAEEERETTEFTRKRQEEERQANTATAISHSDAATTRANTAAAKSETLNAHPPVQRVNGQGKMTWWVWDLSANEYADTTLPSRGPQGKGPIVLPNGNFGNWIDSDGMYADSGVEAAATIDLENLPVVFSKNGERINLASGDTVPAAMSKLQKWFDEFGTLVWQSTVDYETQVNNKPFIPEQLQADFNQADDSRKDFIKNKPTYKTVFKQLLTGSGDITPKVIKDINYNPETGDWTFLFADNSPDRVINVPVDNFLNDADYDGTTHILTMYMSDGSMIEVNLEDLIREYKAAENGGLEVVNGNEFKISDWVFSRIKQQPISGAATIAVSAWTQTGNHWQAIIPDENIEDGCVIHFGSDIATYPVFRKACFLPVADSQTAGQFTVLAEKQPTGSIHLLYSIIL